MEVFGPLPAITNHKELYCSEEILFQGHWRWTSLRFFVFWGLGTLFYFLCTRTPFQKKHFYRASNMRTAQIKSNRERLQKSSNSFDWLVRLWRAFIGICHRARPPGGGHRDHRACPPLAGNKKLKGIRPCVLCALCGLSYS